ncbi:MAG: tRNA (adenosine(37)-N6)-dimethylallyltransferase MiaA [Mycoplasmatales bacterium]
MDYSKYKIIAIIGPTAVGKTDFSIKLAKELNGEVINGDSVQVYKGLDIGSAKIKEEEKQGITHHLIDIKQPNEEYTVRDFQQDGRKKIEDIISRGKVPIIVGGSGLYISALLYDYKFDTSFKESKFNTFTDQEILDYVNINNIDLPSNINLNNLTRVKNYLIKLDLDIDIEDSGKNLYYDDVLIIGLTMKREELYNRINLRVDNMIEQGLIEEVKQFNKEDSSQFAIGYKEIHQYLAHELSIEESIELIKKNSRNFAKRQYTWFNNKLDVKWYDVKENKWL